MKCWADWKSNIKKKAQKLRTHARGTGGGPPCHPLSDIEGRLLEWMTPEGVEGDVNLPEAGGFTDIPLEVIYDEVVEYN
ncbi:hypothetical protein J437_LFUL008138 [Ladona fulva]|uniref:Uncharacterized protein n=1 Tax=Ladona fulva TaxID=123851 RepID=A0A8K0NS70_LADFU|nr:hypothetical protein J437_LFUL008138 [Ladona fulva]